MPIKADENHFSIRQPEGAGAPRAAVARRMAASGPHNTLNLYSPPVLLEYQDTFFHNDSSVMMPDAEGEPGITRRELVMDEQLRQDLEASHPGSYAVFATVPYNPPSGDDPPRVSGLAMLAACYRFLRANDGYRLLVAGHCDTTGGDKDNFLLSELRARNVIHLLLGEKDPWVANCHKRSHVEDWQRILKHVARVFGWPCDPGPIDNRDGPATRTAVRSFQARYNSELDQSIPVDGAVGKQTWGAFFDVYMRELAAILETDVDGLAGKREVRFLDDDKRYIACGEKAPIDEPARDNYRSASNRRVELLYFKPPRLPDLSCHAGTKPFCMKSCDRGACGVYAPGRFQFVYLDAVLADGKVTGKTTGGQYAMRTIEDDLSEVITDEDRVPITLTLNGPVETHDRWAFLEPFEETEPLDDSHEAGPPEELA